MKNTVNVNSITAMSTDDLALLLTAYERFGSLSESDLIEMLADELTIDTSIISDYNEWCYNNSYYDDVIRPISEFEDELDNMDSHEAFRLAYSSRFSWCDDYYTWTGEGNVKSLTESAALDIICDNTGFIKWYVRENILDDLDADEILAFANQLIKEGY